MNTKWQDIINDFNKAKYYLLYSKDSVGSFRDDENGKFYLWQAYHKACQEKQKDNLTFARILNMMYREIANFPYDQYHKYIKPSLEYYNAAIKEGNLPNDKEYEFTKAMAEKLSYILEAQSLPYEEQIKFIKGYEQLGNFFMYDSELISFEHSKDHARLKLRFYNTCVTFLFEELFDIQINTDPVVFFVDEFYCYSNTFGNSYTFDIGEYKIICSSISVEKIEELPED